MGFSNAALPIILFFMKQLAQYALISTSVWFFSSGAAAQQVTATPAAPTEALPTFDMLEMQVDGNTVLAQTLVEKKLYPFLGPAKTVDDVEKARQALEALYKDNGYPTVLVDIPEQDVVNGLVRLKVVEGAVERLKVTGSRYFFLGKIRDKVPALATGQVPYMPKVQEQVADLGKESADRQITPIFRAGSTPGTTEVELRVKDQLPLHGSLEMNGRNSEHTSRSRLIGSLRYDNLWQRFHSASLQYQVSPENSDEVDVWSGTYVLPTHWADSRLALYGIGISSNTQLGASVGGLSVVGSGAIYGARLVTPLPGINNYGHTLNLGVDYKSFNQGISQQGQDLQTSPISYVPFLIGYDANWRSSGVLTTLNSALHFSLRGFGSDDQEFENRRYKAKASYAYFTTELKHLRELPWDMRLAARASGQITNMPLISNEQFAVGGPQSVRGYHQTQQLGDDGANLSVELQSPQLKRRDWEFAQNLRLHAFFDYAYLWIDHAIAPNPQYYRLAGTGAGVRLQFFKHWLGELDWAYPLERQGTVNVGTQRVDFRMAYEF
ncbi:ShlB/FhaC/HecB family hemolysin secretion/activation protein [Methylovulum psychrotolerans]|uniref:ShlB/FhaC/HecB family hemolysin secretion/activation protein n=2 Tax=Methylovulum psychrotolerans TaxID=1704499 RepID=A0A2S5CMK4_9GAMM|nr:ShlB/FhaC/HecB family hemolysin secretion/activation protein [Methylovulum psychrotolerans]